MEIPIGNKGIPPLLVADHCDHSCDLRLNQPVFSSVDMPTADRSRSHPVVGGSSYYYPGEDFRAWKAQFEALREHERWPDHVARRYASACMRDTAHDAVPGHHSRRTEKSRSDAERLRGQVPTTGGPG